MTISAPTVARDRTRVHYKRFHNLYLYITERCQLRCSHCYMGDRLERGLTMPYEKAARIMSYMRRLGSEYITFLGGEPTLHRDLPRMVDYALELGYAQVMINSNGLLEKSVYKIDPKKLHYISFSLDGATSATHNKIRGEGTYEKTVPCIAEAVKAGYPVRIISTISQWNIHEAPAILELADELGVQMVNFHLFSEEGLGIGHSEQSLTATEWIAFYQRLEEIKDNYRTSIWYPPTYATEELLDKFVDEGFRGCVGCSLDRLSIFPDGRAYVCSVLFDMPYHFATLQESGLKLNRERNEFELFAEASALANDPARTGCPAEEVLVRNGKKAAPEGILSMCRLWKSQA